MINNRAMPVLLSARRVATHHRSSTPTVNDFAGALVETWWPAIEAFIESGVTNARTEGINRLVKQVKRSACGFRNPTNGHRRIRFHCTRKYRAATAASRSLPAQS